MLQRDYPPATDKFTTHYSSIELHRHQLATGPRTESPRQGPYKIISIGSFATLYKAQDVLLKAVAEVVAGGIDVHLTLLGDGRYRPEMEQLARDLRIADRIRFLGELPMGNAVLATLDQADLFVLASRQEGLPRATIEAMARGLPCIGSTVGGTPELLPVDEMVPPDDVSALSEKIAVVLRDPGRMIRMSSRNLQVAGRYTEDILTARRNEFYMNLREGTK
jgi:glycosyltransferase involved in cell wall biosynthesis